MPKFFCLSLLAAATFACGSPPASSTAQPSAGGTNGAPTTGSSSPSSSSGSVGTVSNNVLVPRSFASAVYTNELNALLLVVSNQDDYCSTLAAGKAHPKHVAFVAELVTTTSTGDSAPVAPGTYAIVTELPEVAGNYAFAVFRASDSNCNSTLTEAEEVATSGTVTFTAANGSTVSGSYDATYPNGGVAGTFAAPACSALAGQAQSNPTLSCEP